jgi:hypothetical protein
MSETYATQNGQQPAAQGHFKRRVADSAWLGGFFSFME